MQLIKIMNIHYIVTTCIFPEDWITRQDECKDGIDERKQQYKKGIKHVLKYRLPGEPVYIVENGGLSSSFLDQFHNPSEDIHVHYTNNNDQSFQNKGRKELLDIQSCIDTFHINPEDIIIKITGRYFLNNDSFLQKVRKEKNNCDVFFRAGSMWNTDQPFDERPLSDLCTGLIAIKCKHFQQMLPESIPEFIPCEWKYAEYIQGHIPPERQHIVDVLGIHNWHDF